MYREETAESSHGETRSHLDASVIHENPQNETFERLHLVGGVSLLAHHVGYMLLSSRYDSTGSSASWDQGNGGDLCWAIDDRLDIKKLEPRLELAKELRASEMVAFPRMPLWSRILVHIMDPIPALRRANRILIYRF